MRINEKTMLFEDIPPDLQVEMRTWVENVVLRGELSWPLPSWVQDWMNTFNFDERQTMLIQSTALPQRILLSLLYAQK